MLSGSVKINGDGGRSSLAAYNTGRPMAQVCGLGPKISSRLALFCIHHMNQVHGAFVVTSSTCYSALQIVVSLSLLLLLCN